MLDRNHFIPYTRRETRQQIHQNLRRLEDGLGERGRFVRTKFTAIWSGQLPCVLLTDNLLTTRLKHRAPVERAIGSKGVPVQNRRNSYLL